MSKREGEMHRASKRERERVSNLGTEQRRDRSRHVVLKGNNTQENKTVTHFGLSAVPQVSFWTFGESVSLNLFVCFYKNIKIQAKCCHKTL